MWFHASVNKHSPSKHITLWGRPSPVPSWSAYTWPTGDGLGMYSLSCKMKPSIRSQYILATFHSDIQSICIIVSHFSIYLFFSIQKRFPVFILLKHDALYLLQIYIQYWPHKFRLISLHINTQLKHQLLLGPIWKQRRFWFHKLLFTILLHSA